VSIIGIRQLMEEMATTHAEVTVGSVPPKDRVKKWVIEAGRTLGLI
jgi:hypothetical protein